MKAHTKERLSAIIAEIATEAFMAKKAKNPRDHLNRIHTLSREACDYFAFELEAAIPKAIAEQEPEEFGYSCPEPGCDGSAEANESYTTMGAALDAAAAHRSLHDRPVSGIVTMEVHA